MWKSGANLAHKFIEKLILYLFFIEIENDYLFPDDSTFRLLRASLSSRFFHPRRCSSRFAVSGPQPFRRYEHPANLPARFGDQSCVLGSSA